MTDSALLAIDNLKVSYVTRAGEVRAVKDVSLSLREGEKFGLVGESGCGKSTLAMAIMGFLGRSGIVRGGTIRFDDQNLIGMAPRALRRLRGSRLAMVYQDPIGALNPTLTIGSQLNEVSRFHHHLSGAQATQRSIHILAEVKLSDPQSIMTRYPHQLSGGQQQRVVIAMAFLASPSLLILDEPTTALDVTVQAAIVDLLSDLSSRHDTTLLYISHNLGLIKQICNRVGVMYAGQIVESGSVEDVFSCPRHPYTKLLFGCMPALHFDRRTRPLASIPGQLPSLDFQPRGCYFGPRCDRFISNTCDAMPIELRVAGETSDHLVRCQRWNEPARRSEHSRLAARTALTAAAPVLEVKNLSKIYDLKTNVLSSFAFGPRGTVRANTDINFAVSNGETLAVVGESGCGKSTLARVIAGLETATSGDIIFQSKQIARTPLSQRNLTLISSLQMIFQNPDSTLNPGHTIGWTLGRVVRRFGRLTKRNQIAKRIAELLRMVNLDPEVAARKPHQLSGGQKQRVSIARAFAGQPALVVADEPVSALDVSVQAAIINLLGNIQDRHQTALILISHDLSLVRYAADSVMVMYLGEIMEIGPTPTIFEPPYHPYTEALLAAVPIADLNVKQRRIRLDGEIPSPANPPVGCLFSTRCPRKVGAICDSVKPPMQWDGTQHGIKCHIPLPQLRSVAPVVERIEQH